MSAWPDPAGEPLAAATAARLTAQLKHLADAARLRLFSLICAAPPPGASAGALAEVLDLTGPTVSHHLRVLTEAGLAQRAAQGTRAFYTPTPAAARLHRMLPRLIGEAESADGNSLRAALESLPGSAPGPVPEALDPHDVLARVQERLTTRFTGIFSPQTVRRHLADSYDKLAASAEVTAFLPVLTERFAAERLASIAQARGRLAKPVPEVLFVCVHNAGRSQMAAAILRHLAGERVHIRSAGSAPKAGIDPAVHTAMGRIGIELAAEYPKPLTDDVVHAADIVITMGCGDACPVYAGKRYLDWDIDEPAGRPITEVETIRDDIEQRVRSVLLPALLSQ